METPAMLTVSTVVNSPLEKVWNTWTLPQHITQWCQASEDWHAPYAENDLHTGGKFKTTMAAKDGSFSFDFEGTYTEVVHHRTIAYTIADGRFVKIAFEPIGDDTKVTESFEAESTHSLEQQQQGWQAILDSFKKYTESL
jgi:uncharacterized protein YndB with AHSA1/START domain